MTLKITQAVKGSSQIKLIEVSLPQQAKILSNLT